MGKSARRRTASRSQPMLQVALDFTDLHRALKVGDEIERGGVDWIEVGTPLIKSEGLDAVRAIRRRFSSHTILADMKTMDTGAVEVEMASKAGADVVIILGAADDSTIREAVEAGKRYGAKVMADLIGVDDMVSRAQELQKLGISYICVHVGIDQQMRGMNPLETLKATVKAVHVPVAAAGGINSESAALAVKAGADIVIVGGAVTKAEDAEEATKLIKKAIQLRKSISTKLYKKYGEEDIHRVFSEVSTANISDAMQRRGEMQGIKSAIPGLKAVGRAFTVRTYPGDWAKPVEAIDTANPGDIIVIDAGGGDKAVWGELATWSSVERRLGGVVIDGAVRDIQAILKTKFPIFSKYVNPTAGDPKGFGEVNIEITCGGVKVRSGDWIVADDDGVIVVPKELAVEIANRAKDVLEKENRVRAEIRRGSTLSKVLNIRKWEKLTR
jgi:3-hexulose-6-phosphate synthase/6-phospho-3-hexuloisomerase